MQQALARDDPPPARRIARPEALPPPPDVIGVWLRVTSAARPFDLPAFLGGLAGPDFTLDGCRESARLSREGDDRYSAHWYCRFSRRKRDEFAALRLLKRLTGAGFHVLRFDAALNG